MVSGGCLWVYACFVSGISDVMRDVRLSDHATPIRMLQSPRLYKLHMQLICITYVHERASITLQIPSYIICQCHHFTLRLDKSLFILPRFIHHRRQWGEKELVSTLKPPSPNTGQPRFKCFDCGWCPFNWTLGIHPYTPNMGATFMWRDSHQYWDTNQLCPCQPVFHIQA